MIQQPDVNLLESTHQYHHVSGRELIAVTYAFERAGITDYSKIPFEVIEPARLKGDYVHKIAAYYANGVLDEETVDPEFKGHLGAIKAFFREQVKKVVGAEQIVFSLVMGYAGTYDLIYLNKARELCLVDFKTPIKLHAATRWQVAAYAYAYEKMYKKKIVHRYALMLRDDGTYFPHEYKNTLRHDFDEFLTILRFVILEINNKIK